MLNSLSAFIGGIFLLLYGQKIFEFSLQRTSQTRLQVIQLWSTKYRWFTFLVSGFLMLSNRSSVVTMRTMISFISTKMISLRQAILLLVVASFGPVVLFQLMAFNLENYALLVVGLGFLLSGLRPSHGEMLMGFGFMCYGAYLAGTGAGLAKGNYFGDFLQNIVLHGNLNSVIGGVLLYFLTKSILVPMGVAMGCVQYGGVYITSALSMLLGAYGASGISVFVSLLGVGKEIESKELAYANMWYKCIGLLVGMALLIPIILVAQELTIMFSDDLFSPSRHLANAYGIFILGMIVLTFPFSKIYERLVERVSVESRPAEKSYNNVLDQLKGIAKDIYATAEEIGKIIAGVNEVLADGSRKNIGKLQKQQKMLSDMTDDIVRNLSAVAQRKKTEEESLIEVQFSGIVGNIGKIANIAGKEFPDTLLNNLEDGETISQEKSEKLLEISDFVAREYNTLLLAFKKNQKNIINNVLAASYEFSSMLEEKRNDFSAEQAEHELSELANDKSLYVSVLGLLERIHGHIQRVANLISRLSGGAEISFE